MYRVIAGNDTGKTRKLLTECGTQGLFVCMHPERVADKCKAYNIPIVNAISYEDYLGMLKVDDIYNVNDDRPVYIDELEKFINYRIPYLAGYTLTND